MLPDSVANRVKSPYPVTQDPRYAEAVRAQLRVVLDDPDSPVLPLIDVAATARAVDEAPGSDLRTSGEIVMALDSWLRNYDVSLDI